MFMNNYNQGGGTSRPKNHLSNFLNEERRGSGVSMNSTLSLAVLSSCPKHLEKSPLTHNLHDTNEDDIEKQQRTPFLYSDASATPSCSCAFEAPKVPTYYYENKKTFLAAIDLYNKESCDSELKSVGTTPETTKTGTESNKIEPKRKQCWESKGEIRACFQLCSICKDLGKAKSYNEQYFIDVLEICKYRTILCKGCFGHILKEAVGTDIGEIEKRLKRYYINNDNKENGSEIKKENIST